MRSLSLLAAVCSLAFLGGCSTLTSSELQPVSITTHMASGTPVQQVRCSLRNDKGTWNADAPGFVTIQRSAEDLIVECKKENVPDGQLRAISRAAGTMFGNIIFGGGIGALIDHSKGTGYNYPNTLPVRMGQSVVVDRKDEDSAATQQGSSQPQTNQPK